MNSSEHVARVLTLAFAMALVSTCSIGGMSAAQAERWNLIAIVTDDQAEWAVRSYGNDEIVTPNMDRLAREGPASPAPSRPRVCVGPVGWPT